MKNKSYKLQIQEYADKYGKIPVEEESIINYLADELKLTDKDFNIIEEENKLARSIPWETLQIVLPIIPKPSPRPRYSGVSGRFYVTGAAENKKLFKYYFTEKYHIIYTQVYFSLQVYLPTPISSMNKREVYRAECKDIIPISNPDWDNVGKTYSDMIQQILILNDNIISKGLVEKYYSIKPRVVITLKYQKGYDSKFNKKRVENSKSFKEAIEIGNIIELYTEGNEKV